MLLGSTLQAFMRLAHVALAAIVLVAAPLAKAATCAGADVSRSIEASVAYDDLHVAGDDDALGGDHDSRSPSDAQHCMHGQCHQSTTFKDSESVAGVLTVVATSIAPPRNDTALAHVSAGFDRPPKA